MGKFHNAEIDCFGRKMFVHDLIRGSLYDKVDRISESEVTDKLNPYAGDHPGISDLLSAATPSTRLLSCGRIQIDSPQTPDNENHGVEKTKRKEDCLEQVD